MSSEAVVAPFKWSCQFSVLPAASTPPLRGDKIILPPKALEELLSAATTTVQVEAQGRSQEFDPYNPYSVAAQRSTQQNTFERQQNLPHPLTFRLVNPQNGRVIFAGIREFSAAENEVGISPFLRDSLGIEQKDVEDPITDGAGESTDNKGLERLTVHVQELQKGTYVKLRPLEAGYDPEDWKALLERYLRDNFTTLTNGEILAVSAGKEEYRFLVDQLKPSNDAVSLVDTDLEVDIEALNEEQARETLKQRMRKLQRSPGTSDGSSTGGVIGFGASESGQVRPSEYVDYTLEAWARTQVVEIEIVSGTAEADLELFVSPFGPHQRARPRLEEHVFSDLSTRQSKRVKIEPTNTALEHAEALWISVGSYTSSSDGLETDVQQGPIPYHLNIYAADYGVNTDNDVEMTVENSTHAGEARCKNCQQWVPSRTMILHENFCFRNNILCPNCRNVFQKSSHEWKNHWHCPHDSSYGSTSSSHHNHDSLFHTPQVCSSCSYEAKNIPDLAQHRTTLCPAKLILCSFCHLIVPQQGPDDPSPTDPEVIFSGLTPHELTDGARTTECHLCSKIVRLRDMATHLKHHDLERHSRIKPRLCRNVNCGRTIDHVNKNGEVRPQKTNEGNEIGVCDPCFGPLYVSMYDPEGKALRRRVERKYLTQILTGCGQSWCRNEFCKTGRKNSGFEGALTAKEGTAAVKPFLEGLMGRSTPVHFCVDEASQQRRVLAGMLAAEGDAGGKGKGKVKGDASLWSGYALEWCVAALSVEDGDRDRARAWLKGFAPTEAETTR